MSLLLTPLTGLETVAVDVLEDAFLIPIETAGGWKQVSLLNYKTYALGALTTRVEVLENATVDFTPINTQLADHESRLDALEVTGGPSGLNAGSIMIQAGDLAAQQTLPIGSEVRGLTPMDYQLTGWDLWVYPAGSLVLDVRKCALENLPMQESYSITPNGKPTAASAETATGDLTGWAANTIVRSDALSVVVMQNTGVRWYTLLLKGIKQ